MKMIERVARALCIADGHDPDGPTNDVHCPDDPDCIYPWAGYRKQACAAIEAMREPTEDMEDAAYPEEMNSVYRAWQLMIDAALK